MKTNFWVYRHSFMSPAYICTGLSRFTKIRLYDLASKLRKRIYSFEALQPVQQFWYGRARAAGKEFSSPCTELQSLLRRAAKPYVCTYEIII